VLSYQFEVYADAALTSPVAASSSVAAGASGSTSWNGLSSLVDGDTYYWRAVATDTHGATRESAVSTFTLDSANAEPTMPAVATPAFGSKVASTDVTFVVNNAQDSDGDPLSYRFELDTVPPSTALPSASPARCPRGPAQRPGTPPGSRKTRPTTGGPRPVTDRRRVPGYRAGFL
jgi:hypothetical protein